MNVTVSSSKRMQPGCSRRCALSAAADARRWATGLKGGDIKTHKSRLGALVVDCQAGNLFEYAEFWGAVLGSEPESREAQISQRYVRLNGAPGEAQVILQKVDHPGRVHFDIETDNIEAEVNRLLSLGAEIVERMEKWVIREAPSKHRFCAIGPIRPDFEEKANVWK